MKSLIRPALTLFAALTLICGVLYPYAMTGLGQLLFAQQTAGSLLMHDGQIIGSSLIGQAFTAPQYFWGRPSATAPMPNNGLASSGSNLGPSNPALLDAIKSRIEALQAADPINQAAIPIDLVTTSASGLDPEISLAAAYYQAGRIANVRKISMEQVRQLIEKNSLPQYLVFLGEPRINVLQLNLALDQISQINQSTGQ